MAIPTNRPIIRLLRVIVIIIASLWIAGGTGFYLLRFSTAFYSANQTAIDRLLQRIL